MGPELLVGLGVASAVGGIATSFIGADAAEDQQKIRSSRSRKQEADAKRDEIRKQRILLGARRARTGGNTSGFGSLGDQLEDMHAQGMENLRRIEDFGEAEREQINAQDFKLGAIGNALGTAGSVAMSAFPVFQDTDTRRSGTPTTE